MQIQARVAIGCAAAMLTLAPMTAHAQLAQPPDDAASPAPEPSEPPEPTPSEPEYAPVEPVEIEPAQPEPAQSEPAQPEPAQPEQPEPEQPAAAEQSDFDLPVNVRDPTPEERARGLILRRTGTGLMTTGGVVAATGLGLTIAYTVIGDRRQALPAPVLADVEQAAKVAQIGGALLASGIAVVAIGGVIFTRGTKLGQPQPIARLRVTPSFGGLVVSGQF